MYLWRAVDSEGEVLDILVQSRRNKKAALKLMRKLLKKQGYAPNKVVTDKLPSYGAALRDLNMTGKHVTGGRIDRRRYCVGQAAMGRRGAGSIPATRRRAGARRCRGLARCARRRSL